MNSGEELARLMFLIRLWWEKSIDIRGATGKQTKENVNKWLTEFEYTFSQYSLNTSKAYMVEGAREVSDAIQTQRGLPKLDTSDQVFLIAYKQRTQQMAGKIFAQARGMRNDLAIQWKDKKKVDAFYDNWDKYQRESNSLGLSLKEQVEGFLARDKTARTLTYLRDSAGRQWRPDAYSAMFTRTRGRELEDIVRMDEAREMGVNIVQVSNAGTTTPICLNYEGKYYWVDTPVQGLERLPLRTPFHPNCVHRIYPIVRDNQTKFIKTNANKERKFKKASKDFTDGQKRATEKQTKWNLANRIQV